MKKGTMRLVKKFLGMGLIPIAIFFILAGCSAYTGHKVFGVTGIVDGFYGWIALFGSVAICTISAYFLIKSGRQA